jgi:hypothetical protein
VAAIVFREARGAADAALKPDYIREIEKAQAQAQAAQNEFDSLTATA